MSVTNHLTLDTELCADSVEWCPLDGFTDILLCGTYQLDQSQDQSESEEKKTSQSRLGCLYIHQKCDVDGSPSLTQLESHHMAGILDIKWSHITINSQPHFALVNSIGQLVVSSLDEQKKMSEVTTQQMSESCLGLSLEWDNMLCERSHPRITTSDSLGQVHVYQMGEGGVEKLSTWKAHDFEAWITAFDQWNHHIVFTGGDDCRLKMWDTRMEPAQSVLTSKRHTMGVCSIQSNPRNDFIIATGSYDEQLLIWDSRHMRQPITELSLGGGIWRIKWEPTAARHILTATMYNGFHIVDASDIKGSGLNIMCHYEDHQSIAYGADWLRGQQTNKPHTANCDNPVGDIGSRYTIATCSFYDHLLKLWSFDNKF